MAFSDPFIEAATAILKTTYPALAEFTFTTEHKWVASDFTGSGVVDCLSIHGTVEISPTVALDYVIFEKDARVLFRTITIKDDVTAPIAFTGYNSVDNWTGEADVNQKIAAVR